MDPDRAERMTIEALDMDRWLEVYGLHLSTCSRCTAFGNNHANSRCREGHRIATEIQRIRDEGTVV